MLLREDPVLNRTPRLCYHLKLLLAGWAWGSLLVISACQDNGPVKIGQRSPEFSAKDVYGRGVSLSQLKGKTVIVYFWTNSCCGNSVKELQALYDRHKNSGLAIVAINEIDARDDVESYARNNALTFTMLADDDSAIFKRYHGMGFPTVFILDQRGVITDKILGKVPVSKLEKLVQRQFDIINQAEASYENLHRR